MKKKKQRYPYLVPLKLRKNLFRISINICALLTAIWVLAGYTVFPTAGYAAGSILLGDQQVLSALDSNTAGTAEAFKATASASGTVGSLTVYVDASSTATRLNAGLYSDNNGKPGTLLTQGTLETLQKGAWNTINGLNTNIASGKTYWITILSPLGSGVIKFRDQATGGRSETSSLRNLTVLPTTWTTGQVYGDSPLSAYASEAGTSQPILSMTPSTFTFSASAGGSNPASQTLSVNNTGTGTLNFTAAANQSWLAVAPNTGTAPQTVQLTPQVGTLSPGTYNGNVTVTASGAQGSPAVVPVTFNVTSPQPTLSALPSTLTFSATVGGSNPAPQTLNVNNTGTGTLNFTAVANQSWLAIAPNTGTAPQGVQVTAQVGSLSPGTYTGSVTVTASGASGSPAVVPVTFNITSTTGTGSDWLMIDHDLQRSGNAAGESTITTSNVSNLQLKWSTGVDGKVTAQPLFVSSILVAGQPRDLLVAATSNNSIYALDANTGSTVWTRNFGAQAANCAIPGGFGVTASPVIDRTTGRIYSVADNGKLYTLNLSTGTDSVSPLQVIALPNTNKVWGGLNLNGKNLYIATASDGCDSLPWRGTVYRVDVSGAAPQVVGNFAVVPSIPAPGGGGGIWGYGGVSIDPSTGRVFAATGADATASSTTELYTPYADRMIALDPNLNLLGSFEPQHPSQYPCDGAPCDVDFGATPLVFQPNACPILVAAGNKNGNLYVLKAADLASGQSAQPLQTLALNPSNDWLGSGGLGGVPAYWPSGNMVFVTDAGPGLPGISAGVVGLSVNASCTLDVTWSKPLGGNSQPNSTPTVANGIVFVGEGNGGRVHAFDAVSGQELWNSGTAIPGGSTYAAPMVAGGTLYVGSWGSSGSAQPGVIRAFSPGTATFCTNPVSGVLLGNQGIESQVDQNILGNAEAFQTTASACGTVGSLTVYLDGSSTTTKLVAGLYADAGGHPGTLISQGSITSVTAGAWNTLPMQQGAMINTGTPYWIAILGLDSGTVRFRDRAQGCKSETSAQTGLTTLPATWQTGAVYTDCPLSAYGSSTP